MTKEQLIQKYNERMNLLNVEMASQKPNDDEFAKNVNEWLILYDVVSDLEELED